MEREAQTKDKFWLYVGCTVFALVVVIAVVKQSENEKFSPIKQQIEEEERKKRVEHSKNIGAIARQKYHFPSNQITTLQLIRHHLE